MVASGCTAEQIAAVVKASLAEVEQAKSDKRAKGAERQRRHRERNAASRAVTVTECDSVTEAPLSLPLSPQTPLTPTHTPVKKQPARKGHRLPDDWQPKPLPPELAKAVATWPPGAVERELARFRDWAAAATGPNATKSDWDAAWRNWLRKADDEGRHRRAANDSKSTATATERARAILNGRA